MGRPGEERHPGLHAAPRRPTAPRHARTRLVNRADSVAVARDARASRPPAACHNTVPGRTDGWQERTWRCIEIFRGLSRWAGTQLEERMQNRLGCAYSATERGAGTLWGHGLQTSPRLDVTHLHAVCHLSDIDGSARANHGRTVGLFEKQAGLTRSAGRNTADLVTLPRDSTASVWRQPPGLGGGDGDGAMPALTASPSVAATIDGSVAGWRARLRVADKHSCGHKEK